ncbi:Bud-site selection protein [Flagelloscypha sp. PMI_526]|nr:Bud-site selection protein [Flagelloscypha sp. PMI_526]
MSDTPRGVKRKRPGHYKETGEQKLVQKLHHAAREIKQSAKKAKVFETRKIVKQLKSASDPKNQHDPLELEAMFEYLKGLDVETIALTAFRTKLSKDKSLMANPSLKAAVQTVLAHAPLAFPCSGTPAAKAQARLLSSKLLSAEIASVLLGFHNFLNPKAETAPSVMLEQTDERPKKLLKHQGAELSPTSSKDIIDESRDDGWESGSINEPIVSDDNGWESGSIAGESESDDDQHSEYEEPRSLASTKVQKSPSKVSASATSSTFLPSLSVGYVAGSDSDASDAEADIAPARKNRRGQRARRLIWEKKFGKNANHKKKEAEAYLQRKARREERLTAQRNKQGVRRGQKPFVEPQKSDSGWNNGPKTPLHSEQLHPSWEAKKKLKETLGGKIVPSSGKKIRFD